MKMGFRGVNLYSEQPEVLDAFYGKLGMKKVSSGSGAFYGAEYALDAEDETRVIWIWRGGDGARQHQILVFHVEDLDDAFEVFRERGVASEPPVVAVWGGRELLLTDPDGNELLFLE